jgi:hypothetical protein
MYCERVADAPAHVPVDHHALLFRGQHRLGVDAVQRQQALVDVADVLERRRQLEVEAGLGDHVLDLAERIDHAELALVDDEEHGAQERQQRPASRKR